MKPDLFTAWKTGFGGKMPNRYGYDDPFPDDPFFDDPCFDWDAGTQCLPDPEMPEYPDDILDDLHDWGITDVNTKWSSLESQWQDEKKRREDDEDVLINAFDGDQPKHLSLRRQALMKRR